MIYLNCDYLEGCHPAILEALTRTNLEQTVGYGMDGYCVQAKDMIRSRFACPDSAVHFVVGGTQANTIVIASALRPYEGSLCAHTGHINVHETGAIESSGHKCMAIPAADGKITPEQILAEVALQGDDEHMVRPGMVYISMSTELGTVYTLAELEAIYAACRQTGLYLFIDGARLGYALAAPQCDITPEDLPRLCDVFTIGGTKVGALFGEAIVINHPDLMPRFRYMIKQRGGMLAKGRLLGLQFTTLMQDDLYFRIAEKAVEQAQRIRTALLDNNIPLLVDSPTNQLFGVFTHAQAAQLAKDFHLENNGVVDDDHIALRICTSWATTEENVAALLSAIAGL